MKKRQFLKREREKEPQTSDEVGETRNIKKLKHCVALLPDMNSNKEEPMEVTAVDIKSEDLIPREYQIELLEEAKDHNTIACLGTGTGKTFIAILLIREMAHLTNKNSGGKLIFFIVPTVPLVHQQSRVIEKHTELDVGKYFGEMNVDTWSKEEWQGEFEKNQVLVMTAEIGRIILNHRFLSPSQMCLLIMDECHRAIGDSPYRLIMKDIASCSVQDRPRIFGLSASLLNGKCKPTALERRLNDLERTMLSSIATASDYNDVQKYGTDPDEYLIVYYKKNFELRPKNQLSFSEVLAELDILLQVISLDQNAIRTYDDIDFFHQPKKCLTQLKEIFVEMGLFCAYNAAKCYSSELEKLLQRSIDEREKQLLIRISKFFTKFKETYECMNCSLLQEDSVHKLEKLLEIFRAAKASECLKLSSEQRDKTFNGFEAVPVEYRSIINNPLNNNDQSNNNHNMCGIIFVERRITAYVLNMWINEISRSDPEFSFLKANFIVGHSSKGANIEKESAMSVRKQTKVVKAFKNKEFNILVATSVLEEGMDIQKCNIVLRFDLPKDFRSYIQSKGRARAKFSKYVMLVPDAELELFLEDLCNFKTIADMLIKRCHDRQLPTEEEIETNMADDLLPPYFAYPGQDSARITITSSINIVNRYCTLLPCDMTTKLVPRWNVTFVDPDSKETEYICVLHLPINSPLRTPIPGVPMKTKKLAKMAASLKACELLHKMGELNDDLLPFSNAVDNAVEELGVAEDEEVASHEGQPGTNGRRQIYRKGVADVLQYCRPQPNVPCFLHVIHMDLVVPLAKSLNPRGRPIKNPADSSLGFALMTAKELPKVCKFPIFTKIGKVLADVERLAIPIYLDDNQVKDLEDFHRFVISDVLWLEKENVKFDLDAKCSYFVVPVFVNRSSKTFLVDWEFVAQTKHHSYNTEKLKPMNQLQRPVFEESLFMGSVVTRSYLKNEWTDVKPVFYYVNSIYKELTPLSHLEGLTYGNMIEFCKAKYNIDILYPNQPLLDVERCHNFNLVKPLYKSKKTAIDNSKPKSKSKLKHESFREYFAPELCIIHPFPAELFRKATYLPSILYRLNYLLIAEEIRNSVAAQEKVGWEYIPPTHPWPVFNFERSDLELRNHLVSKGEIIAEDYSHRRDSYDIAKNANGEIQHFEMQVDFKHFPGPCPSILLQALTTKSAGDEFDLERLETIGDSFLKYTMSVKLYAQYPRFDEGKLTQLRSRLICNKNLYLSSKKKGLPEFLVHTPFDKEHNWVPPCYSVKEVVKLRQKEKKKNQVALENEGSKVLTVQLISDKCIADSVEALIGSYLLSCGSVGARGFMKWMGLNPFVKNDSSKWPPSIPSPILAEPTNLDKNSNCPLLQGLEKFQDRIGYHFKEPAYLLQAFTHASYHPNNITDCYQRLEFLGDAVLDYLITRKLYEDPIEHSPGELTDLRSALVNNIYFASLAVKFGFHKNLKVMSVKLAKLIDNYIELLENTEAFKQFEVYGYYLEEVECFELEEVECPKALGDLFESVAGAVYLDSGSSLDAVWKVFYPMMKPAIDHMCQHVPKSPVRELYEMVPSKDIFKVIESKEGRSCVLATLPTGEKFLGTGPNKKVAKRSAAKRAVVHLRNASKTNK